MQADDPFEAELQALFRRSPDSGPPTPDCLTDEQWYALLSGEEPDDSTRPLREHLAQCAYCQAEEVALRAAYAYAERHREELVQRTLRLLNRDRRRERRWEFLGSAVCRLRQALRIVLTPEAPKLIPLYGATRGGLEGPAPKPRPVRIELPVEDLVLEVTTHPAPGAAAEVCVRVSVVERAEVAWSAAAYAAPRGEPAEALARADDLKLEQSFIWRAPAAGQYELEVAVGGETFVVPFAVEQQAALT